MRSFQITDLRIFMHELLRGVAFDEFQVVSVSLKTFCSFQIDGLLQKDFFDTDSSDKALPDYVLWKMIKKTVFEQVKGKKKPSSIRIVFRISPDNIFSFYEEKHADHPQFHNISSFFLNVVYLHENETESLTCTTGAAFKTFSTDRSAEMIWDEIVMSFFHKYQII